MTADKDIFADMKKEDRQFGERGGKNFTAKDHLKRQKHRTDFTKFNAKDIQMLSEDYGLEDELEDELQND